MTVSPSQYIIGILMFTMLIVGGIYLIDIFRSQDSSPIDPTKYNQFNSTFNTMSDVTSKVSNLETDITESQSDFGTLGVLNSLISTAWQSLRLLFTSWGFFKNVLFGLTIFGIPAFVPLILGLIITVMIAYSIYSAIFQREI
jgi:hypothetical protein